MPGQNKEKQGEKIKTAPRCIWWQVKPLFRCLDKTVKSVYDDGIKPKSCNFLHIATIFRCCFCLQDWIPTSFSMPSAWEKGKRKPTHINKLVNHKDTRFQMSDTIDEDSMHCFGCTLLHILTLERYRKKLALWPLRKVDTQTWEAFHFSTVTTSEDEFGVSGRRKDFIN